MLRLQRTVVTLQFGLIQRPHVGRELHEFRQVLALSGCGDVEARAEGATRGQGGCCQEQDLGSRGDPPDPPQVG